MVQPYDYSLNLQDPTESFLSGLQVAATLKKAQIERQKRDQAVAFQNDVSAWIQKPTPTGYDDLVKKYPLELESLMTAKKFVSSADDAIINRLSEKALFAHRSENPNAVNLILDDYIASAQNNPTLLKKLQDMKAGYNDPAYSADMKEGLITSAFLSSGDENARATYDRVFKKTEPYIVAGDNLYLKSDVDRAVAAAERTGNSDIEVTPLVPNGAIAKLKANPNLAADFDIKYGTRKNPNPSAQILGGQTGAPSGTFQGQ